MGALGVLGVDGAGYSRFGGNICCLVSIGSADGPEFGRDTCSLILSTGGVKVLRSGDDTCSLMISTGGTKLLRFGDDSCCQILSMGGAELLRFGGNMYSLVLGTGGADLLRFGGAICCLVVSKVGSPKISGRTTLTRESLGLKLLIFDLRLPVLDLDTSTTVAKIEICLPPSKYFPGALAEPLGVLFGWNSDHGEAIRKDRLREGRMLPVALIPRVGEDLLVTLSILKNGVFDADDLLSLTQQDNLGRYYYGLPRLTTNDRVPASSIGKVVFQLRRKTQKLVVKQRIRREQGRSRCCFPLVPGRFI